MSLPPPSSTLFPYTTLFRSLFGVIRGAPVDANRGIYKAELIIEKPSIELARERLATPGQPAGNYLAHFGMHVFSPRIFDSRSEERRVGTECRSRCSPYQ